MPLIDPRDYRRRVSAAHRPLFHRLTALHIALVLLVILMTVQVVSARTDTPPSKPYAVMNRDSVSYSGPGREKSNDLPGSNVTIGILLPRQGSHEAEGKAMLEAAQLALEEEAANPLPEGRKLKLAVGDESGQWGQASNEIVRLIMQNQAVALITSTNGNIAHQAEQVSNKIGIPILTLASDATTTEINIPWIFRLGPSDVDQARAFAQQIYRVQGFRKVLLISDAGHDGRTGGEEFEKAAREFGAPQPKRPEISSSAEDAELLVSKIDWQSAEAIVLWTEPETAAKLVPLVRHAKPYVPIYVCRKAADFGLSDHGESTAGVPASEGPKENGGTWMVAPVASDSEAALHQFAQHFHSRTGTTPDTAAAQTYDAVRLIVSALRRSGPNRARLRDALSAKVQFHGISGANSFDAAGNARGNWVVVKR
jgi:branched-chain amino acid transport system substrate-binding protein